MEQKFTPKQVADYAADLLEKTGWFQGNSISPDSPACMMEAVSRAGRHFANLTNTEDDGQAYIAISLKIKSKVGIGPVHWNDAPGRTKEEVIQLLRGLYAVPAQ
jgi:hypothetical protein